MRKVVIANIDSDRIIDGQELADPLLHTLPFFANRMLWLAEKGDIVILPYEPPESLIESVCTTKGMSPSDISLIFPRDGSIQPLTYSSLTSQWVVDQLPEVLAPRELVSLLPYIFNASVPDFALFHNIRFAEEENDFLSQGGHDLFNCKSAFRQLCAKSAISIAKGAVCSSKQQAILHAKRLLDQHDSIMLKQDINASGDGNIVVTRTHSQVFDGAAAHQSVSSIEDTSRVVADIWDTLFEGKNRYVVIEVFHQVKHSVYAEFSVCPSTLRVDLLNYGIQRINPSWTGFDIPGFENQNELATFLSLATRYVELVKENGFRGILDIDAIITDSSEVFLSECNGRLGGCTHLHQLAETQLGKGYIGNYHLSTSMEKLIKDIGPLLHNLESSPLQFNPTSKTGVIITSYCKSEYGKFEYMVIGRSKAEANMLERQFLDLVSTVEHLTNSTDALC